MNINDEVLQKLQKLSSLKVGEGKKDLIINDLEEILDFVDNLNTLDISHIDATFTTIDGGTPLRDDTPIKSDVINDLLKNSPKTENNFFIVPKIL